MFITDSLMINETVPNQNTKTAVVLCNGTVPDFDLLAANKYTTYSQRIWTSTALKNYIAGLGCSVIVDANFMAPIHYMKSTFTFDFAYAPESPIISLTGKPTWGFLAARNNGTANSFLADTTPAYASHLICFTVGDSQATGVDLNLPADGTLVAGRIFRMQNISVPLSGLISD